MRILNPKLAEAIRKSEIPPPIANPARRRTVIRQRIRANENAVAKFCRMHGVSELALFGSVLREDFNSDSDVDVLVEFLPGRRVSLFDVAGMELELIEMLGRDVDLLTRGDLGPRILPYVEETREIIYACS